MKPRTGYLFKRWRGKHIQVNSDVNAPFYFTYQVHNERVTVALKTRDRAEAEKRMADYMGRIRYSTREEYLNSLIDMGKWAEVELRGAHIAADPVYVETAWERYLASRRRPNTGAGTLAMYRAHWNSLKAWMPKNCPRLADVTPGLAEQYVRYLETPRRVTVGKRRKSSTRTVTRTITAATVDKSLTFLRLMWRVLVPDMPNPWLGLHSAMEHTRETHRALDVAEVQRLVELAQGEWRTLLVTGYTTGLRLKDCCLLDWADVDLAQKAIRVAPAKTKRRAPGRLAIPLLPDLLGILIETPAVARRGAVMPEIAAIYLRDRAAIAKRLKKLFVQCKVLDTQEGLAGFHSLRTTWQTLNDVAGTSRVITRSVLGHKSAGMSDTYSRMDVDTARKAVEQALPRVVVQP